MCNPQKVTVLNASVHTEAPSALQVGHGESGTLEIIIETDPAVVRFIFKTTDIYIYIYIVSFFFL